MKQQYKRILFVAFFLLSFLLINSSSINAHAHSVNEKRDVIIMKEKAKDEDKSEEEIPNGAAGCSSYVGDEKEQCEEDRKATVSTASFMTKAMMSLDNAIADQETDKDYIKNFENSSATVLAYGISLIDPETILMSIINIVTCIFEKIGMLISLIVMILYNVASSSFIQTVIRNVFTSLEAVVFDWSDPNSYIYKVLCLFGLVALCYRLFESRKQHFSISRFLNMIVMTVASCAVIVFIGVYGKPLIVDIETKMESSLTQTFSLEEDKNTPLEIQTKEMLFENLQMKSFRLRHFGVTETSEIKAVDGIENETRVQTLLNEPSVNNAKIERKVYKSTDISYNFGACLKVLGLSLVFLVHRLFLSIIFGAGALLLVLLVLMKEILLGLSVFAVIFTLLKRNKSSLSWFLSRIQWAILCVLAKSFYAIFLYLISYLVDEAVANGGIILMIVIDIALFFGGKYAFKKAPEWIENFLSDFNMEGQGTFQIAKGFLTGDFSPKDAYENYKKRKGESEENSEVGEDENEGINPMGMSTDTSLMDVQEDSENDGIEIKEDFTTKENEADETSDANELQKDEISKTVTTKGNVEEEYNDEELSEKSIKLNNDEKVAKETIDVEANELINKNIVNVQEDLKYSENIPKKEIQKTSQKDDVKNFDTLSEKANPSKRMIDLTEDEKDDFFDEMEWEDFNV